MPAAYHTQIHEVLLTALASACATWSGQRRLWVDLEGHGREDAVLPDVPVARTVGWFTTLFPVALTLPAGADWGARLRAIKEQLRAVPHRGLSYGVLRYGGTPATQAALAAAPAPTISFNYLGQFDQTFPAAGDVQPAREPIGPAVAPANPRPHAIEVVGLVHDGQLQLRWTFAPAVHARATIAGVAAQVEAALTALVAHCQTPGVGAYTPSDFPLAPVDQAALDAWGPHGQGIADLYPLAPVQEGLWFHTAYAPGSGVYVEQVTCRLEGVDVAAFRAAWADVVAHHPVLRTEIVTAPGRGPLQLVRPVGAVPWVDEDWTAWPAATQAAARTAWLAADRARGFAAGAPLLRQAWLRVSATAADWVWTHHHVLLDGWSAARVIEDVWTAYTARRAGQAPTLAPARPYRDYLAWLGTQSLEAAATYWRTALAGLPGPTPLGGARATGASGAAMREGALSETLTRALEQLARTQQVTLNTVVQGAWALLLSRTSGQADVVFGATVAGRPAAVPGVATMVGLFINTLPVRVRVPAAAPVGAYLQALQAAQAEARQYESSPLVAVQGWGGGPRGTPLFDSVLVFENYPVDRALRAQAGAALGLRGVETLEQPHYPLTLVVSPGPRLHWRITYQRAVFDAPAVARLARQLTTLLAGLAAAPTAPVGRLSLLDPDAIAQRAAWNATTTRWPSAAAVPTRLATQAARTPDAVALVAGPRAAPIHVTYGALARRATQLAHRLRAHGVGPEVPVAIALERSVGLVVALLAVWEAGGAYVPLDPALPAARQQAILTDVGAPVVIVDTHTRDGVPRAARRHAPLSRYGRRRARADAARATRRRASSRPARLHHLHLRLHRHAQGRDADTWWARELPALGGERLSDARRRRCAGAHSALLRSDHHGPVGTADGGTARHAAA